MKIYFKVVGYLVVLALAGLGLPILISADDWIEFMVGILAIVLLIPFSYHYFRWTFKTLDLTK